jgi:hypothetical protein
MPAFLQNIFTSYLTTIAGGPSLITGINAIAHGPQTSAEWASAISQIATGIGLALAPDGNKVPKI